MAQENKYVIVREDIVQDPVTIITDGLLIGRLQECELLLNHPAVSRVQAGIKLVEGSYFLFALRQSNPVKLNGKPVEENEALAPGDLIEVGPFLLEIDLIDDVLVVKVSLQIGTVVETTSMSNPNLGTARLAPLSLPGEKRPIQKLAPHRFQATKHSTFFGTNEFAKRVRWFAPPRCSPRARDAPEKRSSTGHPRQT